MIGDCRFACRQDCAFQDNRNANIWFMSLDRCEQEAAEEYDRRDEKKG
jgi:hypothetical protein